MEKNKKLDFDVADDVVFFINNDSTFYRKHAFPAITKFTSICKKGKPSIGYFRPLANLAYKAYLDKYPHDQLPEELPMDVCHEICNLLFKQEHKHIKNKKGMSDNAGLPPEKDTDLLPESISKLCESIIRLMK